MSHLPLPLLPEVEVEKEREMRKPCQCQEEEPSPRAVAVEQVDRLHPPSQDNLLYQDNLLDPSRGVEEKVRRG